jgi:hypothetical protein
MAHGHSKGPQPYSVVAEYQSPEELIEALNQAREAGYTKLDAYTPFPVHGLSDAIGFREEKVPWVVAIAGFVGAVSGLALQSYVSLVDYPMNVGGKPLFSLPAFFPVTFECTILFASFGAVLSMFGLNGLPKPYDPIFDAPNFERASQDRFFLSVEATDPQYNADEIAKLLKATPALNVAEVLA